MKKASNFKKNSVGYSASALKQRVFFNLTMESVMTKFRIVLAALLVSLAIPVSGVSASDGPILDQECYTQYNNASAGGWQEFTPSLKLLEKIVLRVSSSGGTYTSVILSKSGITQREWGFQSENLDGELELDAQSLVLVPGEVYKITMIVPGLSPYRWRQCSSDYSGGLHSGIKPKMFQTYAPQDSTAPQATIISVAKDGTITPTWTVRYRVEDDTFATSQVRVLLVTDLAPANGHVLQDWQSIDSNEKVLRFITPTGVGPEELKHAQIRIESRDPVANCSATNSESFSII